MRLKKLSLMLALTLLVSVSALPVTAHAGGSKDTTPPTLTASLEGDNCHAPRLLLDNRIYAVTGTSFCVPSGRWGGAVTGGLRR